MSLRRKFSANIHGMHNIGDNASPAGSFKSGSFKSVVSGGSFKEVSFGNDVKNNTKSTPGNLTKAPSTPQTPSGGSFKGVFSNILQGATADSSKLKAASMRKGLSEKGAISAKKLPEVKDASDPQSSDQAKEGVKPANGEGSSPSAALKASIIKGMKSSLKIEMKTGSTECGVNGSAEGPKSKKLLNPPTPSNSDQADSKHSLPEACEKDSKKSDKAGERESTKSDNKNGSKATITRASSGNSSSQICKTATNSSDVLEAVDLEPDRQEKDASKADAVHDGTDWGTHMATKGKLGGNGVGGDAIKGIHEGIEKDHVRRRSHLVHDIQHIEPVKQELVEIVNDRKDVWQMDTFWFGQKKVRSGLSCVCVCVCVCVCINKHQKYIYKTQTIHRAKRYSVCVL